MYKHDEIIISNNMIPRTDISKHVVYLDKYTLMHATYAKQCFSEKTISKILSHIAINIKVAVAQVFRYCSQSKV